VSGTSGHLAWTPGHSRIARPSCAFLDEGTGQDGKLSETSGHLGRQLGQAPQLTPPLACIYKGCPRLEAPLLLALLLLTLPQRTVYGSAS
jgi:hypothetical protein